MENLLNSKLVAALKQEMEMSVVLKISDRATSGIPDISVNWHESHLWIETKHANPHFKSQGLQENTMRRLARQGEAWYVIYDSLPVKAIFIVSPLITLDKQWIKIRKWKTDFSYHIDGWDHREIAAFFRTVMRSHHD